MTTRVEKAESELWAAEADLYHAQKAIELAEFTLRGEQAREADERRLEPGTARGM